MGFGGWLFLLFLDGRTKTFLFPKPRIVEVIERDVAGQFVTIGPLLNITNGNAVTSGTITIFDGVSQTAGAGTLTHLAGGIFSYLMTQAETNNNIIGVTLTGASAAPVTLTVPTTAYTANVTSQNTQLTWLQNYLNGDKLIDNTVTPWAEVVRVPSTVTELSRKRLRDVAGANITSTTVVIGSAKDL